MNDQPLSAVALMGATGTGKSALAMRLCVQYGVSIVCCDSMQVYQGLDIGSAKPTARERQQVRHALVDCCCLPDVFSAARWACEAAAFIRQENARGITPLIVGGSGFYLRALLEGFAEIPREDAGVRRQLEHWQREHGTPWLYQRLKRCDPTLAERLHETDTQRIMRALGVFESTGTPLSAWQQQAAPHVPVHCPVFVLQMERACLRQRLQQRFIAMMDAGWLDEVRWLAAQQLPDTHPAMRAVGYRQLLDHLAGDCTLEQAVRDGITATRRYAKRQHTWFAHQVRDAVFGSAEELTPVLIRTWQR